MCHPRHIIQIQERPQTVWDHRSYSKHHQLLSTASRATRVSGSSSSMPSSSVGSPIQISAIRLDDKVPQNITPVMMQQLSGLRANRTVIAVIDVLVADICRKVVALSVCSPFLFQCNSRSHIQPLRSLPSRLPLSAVHTLDSRCCSMQHTKGGNAAGCAIASLRASPRRLSACRKYAFPVIFLPPPAADCCAALQRQIHEVSELG